MNKATLFHVEQTVTMHIVLFCVFIGWLFICISIPFVFYARSRSTNKRSTRNWRVSKPVSLYRLCFGKRKKIMATCMVELDFCLSLTSADKKTRLPLNLALIHTCLSQGGGYSLYSDDRDDADDSQLYISFKTDSHEDLQMVKAKSEMCVKEINAWLVHNGLKINQDKSELVLFTSKFHDEPILDHVEITDEKIKPVSTSKTLGVILDKYQSLNENINKICKSAHFHLRNICKIRRYLDGKSTEILIHAFVSSKLDYCNSLLYGLPAYHINKLQLLQNTAARIVTLTRKYDHIKPVLQSLHRLLVKYRIIFKILLLVYKGLNGLAPTYTADLLSYRKYTGALRSASQSFLKITRMNTKSYGDRAFSVSGPKLWNGFPLQIRESRNINSFKTALKTHLFREAYSL